MGGAVRMRAAGVPRFRHAGLVFGPGWNEYQLAELGDEQRAAIRTYLGRFIAVHPGDERKLALWLGSENNVEKAESTEPAEIEAEATATDYDAMTVRELRGLADDLGIEIPSNARKADIIELLEGESDGE